MTLRVSLAVYTNLWFFLLVICSSSICGKYYLTKHSQHLVLSSCHLTDWKTYHQQIHHGRCSSHHFLNSSKRSYYPPLQPPPSLQSLKTPVTIGNAGTAEEVNTTTTPPTSTSPPPAKTPSGLPSQTPPPKQILGEDGSTKSKVGR